MADPQKADPNPSIGVPPPQSSREGSEWQMNNPSNPKTGVPATENSSWDDIDEDD